MKTAAKKTTKAAGGKQIRSVAKKPVAKKAPAAIGARQKVEWEPKKHEKEEQDALKLFVDTYSRF